MNECCRKLNDEWCKALDITFGSEPFDGFLVVDSLNRKAAKVLKEERVRMAEEQKCEHRLGCFYDPIGRLHYQGRPEVEAGLICQACTARVEGRVEGAKDERTRIQGRVTALVVDLFGL